MSNEDLNNDFHWRNKLEDLEHLPGETFNKEAAWDKLHRRLQGKNGHQKILWYGVAAACLLFVLMITLLNYHKSTQKISKTETATGQPKTTMPGSTVDENKKTENINTVAPVKDKMVTVTRKSDQSSHGAIRNDVISKIHIPDAVSIHWTTEPLIKPLQLLNNTSIIAMTLPEKKKLKVVHINELGDPVVESPDMARNDDKHSFKLKLARGEVFVNSSVVSKTTGLTILKTKPSSN